MTEIPNPKYTTGRGIKDLTPEGRSLLRRCWEANPDGCRSADNECGPPPTYPCATHCGISIDEHWQLMRMWEEQKSAQPLSPQELEELKL